MDKLDKDLDVRLAEAQKVLDDLNKEREELFEQQEPINAALVKNYDSISQIQGKIGNLLEEKMGDEYDWATLLSPKNRDTLHKLREKAVNAMGLYPAGYWTDTGQPAVRVMVYKDRGQESIEETLLAIRTLAPFYIPHSDGAVWFSIFEWSLSENGTYRLEVKPDTSAAKVVKTRYGRESDVIDWRSLEEAVSYIAKHHYYE